jgi:hypothetical protein
LCFFATLCGHPLSWKFGSGSAGLGGSKKVLGNQEGRNSEKRLFPGFLISLQTAEVLRHLLFGHLNLFRISDFELRVRGLSKDD